MPFSSAEIAGELSKKYTFDFTNFEQAILIESYGSGSVYMNQGLCLAAVWGWHNHIGPCRDLTEILVRFEDYRDRHFHFYILQKLGEIRRKTGDLHPWADRYYEDPMWTAGLETFEVAEAIMKAQYERLERLGREHPGETYEGRRVENLMYEMAKEFCPTLTEIFRKEIEQRSLKSAIDEAIIVAYDDPIRQYYCHCSVYWGGKSSHGVSLIVLLDDIPGINNLRGSAAFFDPNVGLFLFKDIQEFFNFEREFFRRAYPEAPSVRRKVDTIVYCLKS